MNSRKVNDMTGKKYDSGKPRYDLVPVLALEEVAKVLTYGADKYNESYDNENWRKVEHSQRRYYSASQRHQAEVRKGNQLDNETGLHHLAHAISCLMFQLEKELEGQQSKSEDVWSWQFAEKEYYSGFGNVKPEETPIELEYGSGKYVTKPDPNESCKGCAFEYRSEACEDSWETLDCADNKIVWIKKETN